MLLDIGSFGRTQFLPRISEGPYRTDDPVGPVRIIFQQPVQLILKYHNNVTKYFVFVVLLSYTVYPYTFIYYGLSVVGYLETSFVDYQTGNRHCNYNEYLSTRAKI